MNMIVDIERGDTEHLSLDALGALECVTRLLEGQRDDAELDPLHLASLLRLTTLAVRSALPGCRPNHRQPANER